MLCLKVFSFSTHSPHCSEGDLSVGSFRCSPSGGLPGCPSDEFWFFFFPFSNCKWLKASTVAVSTWPRLFRHLIRVLPMEVNLKPFERVMESICSLKASSVSSLRRWLLQRFNAVNEWARLAFYSLLPSLVLHLLLTNWRSRFPRKVGKGVYDYKLRDFFFLMRK